MADQDPLDSSDQEFPDIPVDPAILRAGQASIERMRENAVAHRMDSKVALRKLDRGPVIQNPALARDSALWANRFEGFYVAVLGKSPGQVPSPDDVLRFFLELPGILGPNRLPGRVAYSLDRFVDGATAVLDNIFYKHSSARDIFRKGNFDMKLKSTFSTHLANGVLTKDSYREAQWVSSHLLANMCRALLLDAADRGTKSWDYRLQQALLLAMLSGTAGRIGDVLGSYDTQTELLTWGDVTLKLFTDEANDDDDDDDDGTKGHEFFVANIKLRFTKGKKDKGGQNHDHRFSPLQPRYASACVVRLLITHALRMGTISGAPCTFNEVLDTARRAPGKFLRWTTPDSPVFLGHSGRNTNYELIRGRPASARIGGRSLNQGAELLGLPIRLRSHDVRRGGARDVSKLPQEELPGLNLAAARRVLGHTHRAVARGVTDSYVGSEAVDHYGPRMHNPDILQRDRGFGLEDILAGPYARPRRYPSSQIDQVCKEQGWPTSDKRSRDRAGKMLREADKTRQLSGRTTNDDVDAQDDGDDDPGEPAAAAAAPAKRPRTGTAGGSTERPLFLKQSTAPQHVYGHGTEIIPEFPVHTTTHGQPLRLPGGGNDDATTTSSSSTTDIPVPTTPYPPTHVRDSLNQSFFEYPPPPGEEEEDDDDDDDDDEADPAMIQDMIASSAEAAEAAGLVDELVLYGDQSSGSSSSSSSGSGSPRVSTTAEGPLLLITSGDTAADEALRSDISSSLVGGFVDCLSKVNVITRPIPPIRDLTTESETQAEYQARIGYPTTKDPPTYALFKCPNSARGCAEIYQRASVAIHHAEAACAHSEREKIRVKCPVEGCKAVVLEHSLKTHIYEQHTQKDKLRDQGYNIYCRLPGCGAGPYEMPSAVVQHLNRVHGLPRTEARSMEAEWSAAGSGSNSSSSTTSAGNTQGDGADEEEEEEEPATLVTGYPMLCPLLQCTSTLAYKDRKSLRDHFYKVHRTAGKGKGKGTIPRPQDFKDVPHAPVALKPKPPRPCSDYNVQCLIPGCKRGKTPFPNPTATIKHLSAVHKMAWGQAKTREREWASAQADKAGSHTQPQGN